MISPSRLIQRIVARDPRFSRVGSSTEISIIARIRGRRNIRLGRDVRIAAGAVIDAGHGEVVIGDHCVIHAGAMLLPYGGSIRLGEHTTVNPYCVLYGHGNLTIGSGVRIATGTTIIPSNHLFDSLDTPIRLQGESKEGIVVEDDVWIGAGVTILDGVTIGRGSVLAAGAVVASNVAPYTVAGGIPARTIRARGAPRQTGD